MTDDGKHEAVFRFFCSEKLCGTVFAGVAVASLLQELRASHVVTLVCPTKIWLRSATELLFRFDSMAKTATIRKIADLVSLFSVGCGHTPTFGDLDDQGVGPLAALVQLVAWGTQQYTSEKEDVNAGLRSVVSRNAFCPVHGPRGRTTFFWDEHDQPHCGCANQAPLALCGLPLREARDLTVTPQGGGPSIELHITVDVGTAFYAVTAS